MRTAKGDNLWEAGGRGKVCVDATITDFDVTIIVSEKITVYDYNA